MYYWRKRKDVRGRDHRRCRHRSQGRAVHTRAARTETSLSEWFVGVYVCLTMGALMVDLFHSVHEERYQTAACNTPVRQR